MNLNLKNLVGQKAVMLMFTLTGVGIFIASTFSRNIGICPVYSYSLCSGFFDGLAETFLPFIPVAFFYLITYRLSDKVFLTWSRFTLIWIPLSMVLIFIAPEYSSDWMLPIASKGGAVMVTSALFIIISIAIIIWKSIALRSRAK